MRQQILIFQSVPDDGDRVKSLHLSVVISLDLNCAQRFKVHQHLGLTEYYKIAILTIQLYLKNCFMCDVSICMQMQMLIKKNSYLVFKEIVIQF